ncbi:MAG TPA: RNA methyltransferase [Methylomirabilota bacterium]|nr:RNA methyltransferase [Methylomirabilota bacterium]
MKIEPVDDAADPRIASYREARDPELRARQGIFIAEGRTVVARLLEGSRFRARSVLVTPAALEDLRAVLEGTEPGLSVHVAPAAVLRSVMGFNFHRGCLAMGERGPEPSPEPLIAPPGPRLLLVLEGLADPDNVGAVFRNAMAFGVHGVLLSPGCTDPLYRKAIRTSMGSTLQIPWARLGEWPRGLARLRQAGYTVWALTPRGAADLADFGTWRPVPERVALLLGAEGKGLSDAARGEADLEVRIPMVPGADSLNVATASGIALHRLRPAAPSAG